MTDTAQKLQQEAMNEQDKAYKTPTTDLLSAIPEDYRVWFTDGHSSHHIPVGRLAREAIAEIQRLKSELAAAKVAVPAGAVVVDASDLELALTYIPSRELDQSEYDLVQRIKQALAQEGQ